MKKTKNVVMSVPEENVPAPGQVLQPRSQQYTPGPNGAVVLIQQVDIPAGRYQIQATQDGATWQDVGTPTSVSLPTTYGINIPLNGNVGWQIVWLGQ